MTDVATAPGGLDDGMREFMSGFPTGVAVVTTRGHDGEPHGLTCSSMTSVALDPPTLLVCLRQNTGGTLSVLLERGVFAVNLLHDGASHTARLMARTAADRFSNVRWNPSPLLGAPWLEDDTHATAECRVSGTVSLGTHTVVFGEVVGTAKREGDPLLYGYRQFSSWRHTELHAEPRDR
ncbi:flavin reductase family protein [Myceligenerans crystallogenes]|uniref:Flavin reductase like domain-containing protein n=1 Tax=Myceligenerans crystallogenes TaxID=316335 RepID=A0ABN2N2E1_9MICO